jgi:hypothetical protein
MPCMKACYTNQAVPKAERGVERVIHIKCTLGNLLMKPSQQIKTTSLRGQPELHFSKPSIDFSHYKISNDAIDHSQDD